MKFYIASTSNADNVKHLATFLKEAGHVQTYDWTTHGSKQDTPSDWPKTANDELNGVIDADTVIVILPGGRGTHVEMGAALAVGRPIILIGDDDQLMEGGYNCVFHFHPGVIRLDPSHGVAISPRILDMFKFGHVFLKNN